MIALNEEKLIGDAIRSCSGVVSETIVVDGGSTDQTVEIAKSLGARVIFAPWQDNFSIARNISFDAATCDWVFVLDCDEQLRPASRRAMRDAIVRTDAVAFLVDRYEWHAGDSEPTGQSRTVRLARRDTGCRLHRRIHETLVKPFSSVGTCHVQIDHFGYAVADPNRKYERNVRLLQMQLNEDPTDGYLWTDLAYHHFCRREDRWVIAASKALGLLDTSSSRCPHSMVSVLLEMVLRAPAEVSLPVSRLMALQLAERWYPHSLPLLALRVRHAVDSRQDSMAIQIGEMALQMRSENGVLGDAVSFNRPAVTAHLHLLVGFACARTLHFGDAVRHFTHAATHPATAGQANQYIALIANQNQSIEKMKGVPQ